jgi:hypothetical protein
MSDHREIECKNAINNEREKNSPTKRLQEKDTPILLCLIFNLSDVFLPINSLNFFFNLYKKI